MTSDVVFPSFPPVAAAAAVSRIYQINDKMTDLYHQPTIVRLDQLKNSGKRRLKRCSYGRNREKSPKRNDDNNNNDGPIGNNNKISIQNENDNLTICHHIKQLCAVVASDNNNNNIEQKLIITNNNNNNNNNEVEPQNICDRFSKDCCNLAFKLALALSCKLFVCLYSLFFIKFRQRSIFNRALLIPIVLLLSSNHNNNNYYVNGFANELDKTEDLNNVNIDQIAAIFNKVAYGSTTKRSIPDNTYPLTTLATPLLTTYRYSDGSDEWARVDIKNKDSSLDLARSNVDFEQPELEAENIRRDTDGYGTDLEKDHVLPTPAPAADILKNNNNRHYSNPNRYNNDRIRPDVNSPHDFVTENIYKTTTVFNSLRNVKPTKSMYGKASPSYIPPSRAFFTPPLPPALQNPYADKPTLRGTNSDSFANRRPIPPPSLMPSKDRIPFRPDLPKVNMEKVPTRNNMHSGGGSGEQPQRPGGGSSGVGVNHPNIDSKSEKKKSLNTPSQTIRGGIGGGGDFYGGNRNVNESNFEYMKPDMPGSNVITRILSGSNGRQDSIPEIIFRTITSSPNIDKYDGKFTHNRAPSAEPMPKRQDEPKRSFDGDRTKLHTDVVAASQPSPPPSPPLSGFNSNNNKDTSNPERDSAVNGAGTGGGIRQLESVTVKKDIPTVGKDDKKSIVSDDVTTQMSDSVNLPNVKEKEMNTTTGGSDQIWLVCWNVHVYLVVVGYIILAIFSIYKLIRYENDPHMFSKSYFLTIHLMLTVICVLRIFYLIYDPYNVHKSFNIFLYNFLHSFPLSLLATTFSVLIVFLLKRTLAHLEVKTRPVILVIFALVHVVLCFCLSILETLGYLEKASFIICKPIFVLLAWALGFSYLYLYRIIKNVLAKKSQNLSEMCTQNISYASHITIAVALLFILLGLVQLYALFFIKFDTFSNNEVPHHWILWSFELSVRFIEISIITLLAIVVSLRMSQREKQASGGFPLFPCTTSDSSTDNIYPNNCTTNPNALNYSRQDMVLDNLAGDPIERPNLLKTAFQNDSFDKKSTLERRFQNDPDRFERPKWGSDRFNPRQSNTTIEQTTPQLSSGNFDRIGGHNSLHNSMRNERGSIILGKHRSDGSSSSSSNPYETAKYYTTTNNENYQNEMLNPNLERNNIYSEPIDNPALTHQYERTRHDFERSDFDRRSSRNSSTNTMSGRRSTTSGRSRQNHSRPHLGGIQTLPFEINHDGKQSMLVAEQGVIRFKTDKEQNHFSGA